jgi:hypothetical protein
VVVRRRVEISRLHKKEVIQINWKVLRSKILRKCLPLTVQEIQKVLPKEGS